MSENAPHRATAQAEQVISFQYTGTTDSGLPLRGTLDAPSQEQARAMLAQMGVQITELERVEYRRPSGVLRGESLIAFNQQLAYLTSAGVPLGRGLRALSSEASRPSIREAIRQVADEVDRGTPLGRAFDQQRGRFPALYGKLVDAGVASHNLPGVLLGLSRHMEMVARLRGSLWRASAYPLIVVFVLGVVVLGVTTLILPMFKEMFDEFFIEIPPITRLVMAAGPTAGLLSAAAVVCVVLLPVFAGLMHRLGASTWLADAVLLPIRKSLAARWCDAAQIGVGAGLPLPQAIMLASDAVGSPSVRDDSLALIRHIEAGSPRDHRPKLHVLTDSITASIQTGPDAQALANMLSTLSELYRRQVIERISTINHTLPVVLLTFTGILVGFVVLAMFLPLVKMMSSLM